MCGPKNQYSPGASFKIRAEDSRKMFCTRLIKACSVFVEIKCTLLLFDLIWKQLRYNFSRKININIFFPLKQKKLFTFLYRKQIVKTF